jgi:hypothetical protein
MPGIAKPDDNICTGDSMTLLKLSSSSTTDFAHVGETITYYYAVTNTGTTTLNNVAVIDSELGPVTNLKPKTIAPDEVASGFLTYTITWADIGSDIVNTADALATGKCGIFTIESEAVTVPMAPILDIGLCIEGHSFSSQSGRGIPGWEIILMDYGGNEIAHTTTGENGLYSFCHLEPGDYTVCEEEKDAWTADTCIQITLGPGDSKNNDFVNELSCYPGDTKCWHNDCFSTCWESLVPEGTEGARKVLSNAITENCRKCISSSGQNFISCAACDAELSFKVGYAAGYAMICEVECDKIPPQANKPSIPRVPGREEQNPFLKTPVVCNDKDACTTDARVGDECVYTPVVCDDRGHSCVDGICETCTDGEQNGDETDVDCGGSCPACPTDVCTPAVCGSITQCDPSCGQMGGYCFLTTEGYGKCLANWWCSESTTTCTSSADCGDGVCVTGSCCGVNVCRPALDFCSEYDAPINAEMSTTPHDGPTGAWSDLVCV